MSLENAGNKLSKIIREIESGADYRRGYRDAALGVGRKEAVNKYGIENLGIHYWMGYRKSLQNMVAGNN